MTTSKDISGGGTASHQCSAQITGKGGVHTCRHKGNKIEDGKHWCGLHVPSNVAKKKERKDSIESAKAAERAAKKAQMKAREGGDVPAVEFDEVQVALNLPENVEEAARSMLVMASEAQQALARISNMSCKGWPENTPAENYKIMLQTINDEAQKCADETMLRVAKARQILEPVGYPS